MKSPEELLSELLKLPTETTWVEFKHDNYDPLMIGKDICALANSAVLVERDSAYMLWGIKDDTHEIVGTDKNLLTLKKGNEEIENWLRGLLSENADFEYEMAEIEGKKIGILKIAKAESQPVTFEKQEYIRVGSYTKKLQDVPALKKRLWDKIRNQCFEEQYAVQELTLQEVLKLLDIAVYFDLTHTPQPGSIEDAAHYLAEDEIVVKQDNGRYAITNLGTVLFAKNLRQFPRLKRKAFRVAQYADNSKFQLLKDETFFEGYAVGLKNWVKYIAALLPSKEMIEGALRKEWTMYPELAIRESVANALIHQDFSVTGTGPVVEIFKNRIEVTNAGVPLVSIKRIVDNPPRSRNVKLADLMRRMYLCEELGTGWDKIVGSCEMAYLPAPKIWVYEESTKVGLFAKAQFKDIPREERLWACYLHSCLKYVKEEQMTNQSLRARFDLPDSSSGRISRLLKEAIAQGLIKPFDPRTAPRYMKYIPYWA